MKITKYAIALIVTLSFLTVNGSSPSKAAQSEARFEWKNYVIRFDRGWDILCEPYEIKPDDWILKIFSQKGEIAHENFREFLGIFKRLNPHVKDVDRIRPGQIIDIPLKKLSQGALPGQSSGIVTIPFVSLNSVDEVLTDYSVEYTIKPGDCVSTIIAKRFGSFGSNSYSKGLKMFQSLNPEVENINKIIAGQKIYVPAPSIQEESWYESMFDSQGNLTDKIGIVTDSASPSALNQPMTSFPLTGHQGSDKTQHTLSQAAKAIEGTILNRGTYYFPLESGDDFELDLSKYPILEKKNGQRYIITNEDKIMGEDLELLKMILSDVTIVKTSPDQTIDQLIDSLLENEHSAPGATSLNVSEHGTNIWLQAKWIETIDSPEDDIPRKICIMPIESSMQRTDSSISRYLAQHNIVLKEVLADTGDIISAQSPSEHSSAKYTITDSIAAVDKKQFVDEFAQTMQWRYIPNVSISFPYADIQINALSNMLSSENGDELLIDFGNLYGDAVAAIEKNGLKIVQIKEDDTPMVMVTKILKGMNTAYTENPSFMAAQRLSPYNTTLRIEGFFLSNNNLEKVLLATNSLNHKVVDFLDEMGVKVILLGQSKLFY